MRFRSTTGQDVHIGLTTGHTALIPADDLGVELDKRFHKEAIAQECLPVGMASDKEEAKPTFDRKEVVRQALQSMLSGSDSDDFTNAGKPNLIKLNARLGFTASRSEVDAIWDELSKDED